MSPLCFSVPEKHNPAVPQSKRLAHGITRNNGQVACEIAEEMIDTLPGFEKIGSETPTTENSRNDLTLPQPRESWIYTPRG